MSGIFQRLRFVDAFKRRAVWGGCLTAVIVLSVQALTGGVSWSLLGAVLSGVALCLALPTQRDPRPSATEPSSQKTLDERDRFVVAEALLATMADPVILVGSARTVIKANDAARRLFPALKDTLPLAFGLRNPDVLAAIEHAQRSGVKTTVPYVQRVPDERHFEILIGPLTASEGHPGLDSSVVLLFRDLTSVHQLEKMRVDFVANASHELRTPLTSLVGFIDTLQTTAKDDAIARDRFLSIMREQAQRMARLIDSLLSLSRIEMRLHSSPSGLVDLRDIVRQAIETLTPLATDRGVELAYDPPATPFRTKGDREELRRVAENLIENAIKYGDSGKRVDVALSRAEPPSDTSGPAKLLLTVTDYGPGIDPKDLPRLTERFYRSESPATQGKTGAGLGLAITKHILARHKGQLRIDSEPGKGARFIVSLEEAPLEQIKL